MIAENITTPLNSSTYTAVTVRATDTPTNRARVITYWVEGLPEYYQATSSSGDGEALIPADVVFVEADVTPTASDGKGDGLILFYAKAVSGTPNLVVKLGEIR